MEQKTPNALILRGALGAAAGGLFWLVLSYAYAGILIEAWSLLIGGYFLLVLWTSLFVGGLTGVVIWRIHYWTGTDLGVIARFVIGTVIAFILMVLYFFIQGDDISAALRFSLFFALAVGGFAGILVGSQIRAEVN